MKSVIEQQRFEALKAVNTRESSLPAVSDTRQRQPTALWALGIGTFGMGTGEFVVAGLLLSIASSLKISTSAAGLLVSAYAVGVIIGAPTVTVLTRRLPRKKTLLIVLALFILGNLMCATASGYTVLMIARFVTGLAQASFFGLGSVIAAELVPEGKKASAIAIMFTGVTLASIVGVPIGILIGQSFGWRFTFYAIATLGVAAILSVAALLPNLSHGEIASVRDELRVLREPQVLLAFAMTVLGNGAVVVVLTYIAPLLTRITEFSAKAMSPILLLFGLGFMIGNAVGGKLADRRLMGSLIGMLAALCLVLLAFSFAVHYRSTALITVFLFGVTGFGIVPGLQLRAVSKAIRAPTLGSAFNIASFNVGGAGGALLGAAVLRSHWGLDSIPRLGAVLALGSALIGGLSLYIDKTLSFSPNWPRQRCSIRVEPKEDL